MLKWLNKDVYSTAPQLTAEGRLVARDLLHSPTGFETLMEQIRDSVPNTALHLEEIWMKLSLGAVEIVNDNTKYEIDDVMRWLSGLDLDTPTTTPFASTATKIIVWASLTGRELIFQASETHVERASTEANT